MRLHDSMIADRPKFVSALGVCLGSIVFLCGIYLFVNRVIFLAHATPSSAPIVAVSHKYVPKGRGAVRAYVPTVQLHGGEGRALALKVDTFNEEPVYTIGQQMRVSCNLERGCIEDTFFAKWGAVFIDLFIALLFFSPLLAWKSESWQPHGKITGLKLERDV